MPFCTKCGTEVPENVNFCTKCGSTTQAGQKKNAAPNLSLWEYHVKCWKNYAVFGGRARRKEYWGFALFYMIILIGLAVVGGFIGGLLLDDEEGTLGTVLYGLYCLAAILPCFGVLIRRLHDIGKSGWWCLIALIPIVGSILLLIWVCTDSQPGENTYGQNPKRN